MGWSPKQRKTLKWSYPTDAQLCLSLEAAQDAATRLRKNFPGYSVRVYERGVKAGGWFTTVWLVVVRGQIT